MRIKTIISIFLLPLALNIPSLLYLFNDNLVLFPNTGSGYQIEAYASPDSSIENFHANSKKLSLSYILRERPEPQFKPYGSFVIWLKRENRFYDLSAYDYISFELESTTAENVSIFIKTYKKGVSKPEKHEAHTLRHNEYNLSFVPGILKYKLWLHDFITPDWWYTMMKVPLDEESREKFTAVSAIDFQFIDWSDKLLDEKIHRVVVDKIYLHKSYPLYCIFLNAVSILYCLILILFRKRKIPAGLALEEWTAPEPRELPYKKLELENYADDELTRIMTYIVEHYSDCEISNSIISTETGIPRAHIAELLKKEYDSTCKQVITRIRITEAKRLLKSTDRLILEIALKVGFNDISTFNRSFKKYSGMTPRQFRSHP